MHCRCKSFDVGDIDSQCVGGFDNIWVCNAYIGLDDEGFSIVVYALIYIQ